MQIIRPNQTFRILWVVADPSDATTYYPQVTIKQTLNGAVLLAATNLVLDSTGRYYYDWIVPGDYNGGGTEIDVTVTVYTDSGHTLYSSYERENRVYNIFDLASLMRGGGGSSLDERDVARIIKKEVALLLAGVKIPDYGEHFDALGKNLGSLTNGFSPALNALLSKNNNDVLEALKKLPQYGQSLDKILSATGLINNTLSGNHGQALEGIQNLAGSIGKITDILTSFTKWMRGVEQAMGDMPEKFGGRAEKYEQSMAQVDRTLKAITRVLSSIQSVTVHTGLNLPGEDLPQEAPVKKPDYSHVVKKLIGTR